MKSVKTLINGMGSKYREGNVKPKSWVEPYLNIRKAITKAAGLTAITRVCAMENIHTEHEVGIFLNGIKPVNLQSLSQQRKKPTNFEGK